MKNRRMFAKTSMLLAGGAVLTGRTARAAKKTAMPSIPGVVYSESCQGKWKGKSGSHAPVLTLSGRTVTMETKHGMSPGHYIVRHTLVTVDGTVLGEHTFSGSDEKAVSTVTLPDGFSGKLIATSFCNLHDLWVSEMTV